MGYQLAPSTFIDDVLHIVDEFILEFVKTGFESIVNHWTITGLLTSIFTLYVLYFLYQAQFYNTPLSDATIHLVKLVLVFMIATNWGIFYTLIYNVATNEPLEILKLLQGGAKGDGTLNEIFINGIQQALVLLKNMPLSFKGVICTLFAAFLLIVSTLLFTLLGLSIIVISKFYLAVNLAIAPYFLFMYLFNGTKGLSESWVKACLNYALVPVFVGCALSLSSIFAKLALQTGQMPDFIGIIIYFATALICAFLIKTVPEKAASLTSSLAIAGAGRIGNYAQLLGSNLSNATSSVSQGAKSAKNTFAQRAQRVQEHLRNREIQRQAQESERRDRRARSGY